MTRERFSDADRAHLAHVLCSESERRQKVRLGRWNVSDLINGRVDREDAEEGLRAIVRRSHDERSSEAMRDVGVAVGQLVAAGVMTAEAGSTQLMRFVRETGTGPLEQRRGLLQRGFLDGQADVRRAREPHPRRAPRRPQPSARAIAGPWSLRQLAAGEVAANDAEGALAAIITGLGEHSTSTDLIRASRAAGQLGAIIDWRRMVGALEAAGRRAGLSEPRRAAFKGLDIGMAELAAAERGAA